MEHLDFDPTTLTTKQSDFGIMPDHLDQTIDPLLMMGSNGASSQPMQDASMSMQQYNQAMMMGAMPNAVGSPSLMMGGVNQSYAPQAQETTQWPSQLIEMRRQSVSVLEGRGKESNVRKRRASHRDVERRRREHINDSIASLADLMGLDRETHNKGSILSAAVTYMKQQQEQVQSLKHQVEEMSTLH